MSFDAEPFLRQMEEEGIIPSRKIMNLARGFPSPAIAGVIEGVDQQDLPAGVSRIDCHERPEP